jgi:glycolate oxidase FAD binding subunit
VTVPAAGADATRALDGFVPRDVLRAHDVDEVVAALLAANASGDAVVLWGGGTRIDVGGPLLRYDIALDLTGLAGVVDHEPGDLTCTVAAGTTVAELQSALAPHGQWWPVEVAHPERATVGGTIAGAAIGPSRFRYLHPRDWTIGVRAVLGDGTVARAGGRVVKNATGYDLARAYSGSYGTLCAIVEVSLKLTPLPQRRLTLRADLPNVEIAYERTRQLLRERLPLDAVAVVTGERASLGSPTWTALFIRVAGTGAAVERLRADIERRLAPLAEAEDGVWQRIADLPVDAPMTVRGTWPPAEPLEIYPLNALWYPGLEILFALDELTRDDLVGLRQAAESRAGALVLEKVPLELKRALGVWGTSRVPLDIARRLRAAFDPRGVLAPGRMPDSP